MLGIYLISALFFLESTIRMMTIGEFMSEGLFFSLLFAILVGLVVYGVSICVSEKNAYRISYSFLGIAATIYSSQLVYYKIFGMFYTFYSVGNAGQILEFWKEILLAIMQNSVSILLLYVPLILLILVGKKYIKVVSSKVKRVVIPTAIVGVYMGSAGFLQLTSEQKESPYHLYYNERNPIVSVEKLGLMTTMRLDLQRILVGWEPKLYEADYEVSVVGDVELDFIEDITVEDSGKKESLDDISRDYHLMPINFDGIIEGTASEEMKEMHRYFQNVEPTSENRYTGKYKGYNLILITAEAFSPYAIHKELTPTLYKLVHEGYNFTEFYNPSWEVSTSDGEYVACIGLIPKSGVWSFFESGDNYMPFVMGNQLQNRGYITKAYHNHTYDYYKRHISHPNMGYDYKGLGNGLEVKKSWPESDLEMMEKTIEEYANTEPFHAYYMTVSGHMNYDFKGNAMSYKNRDLVKDLPYSEAGKAYIACQIELDRALEYPLQELEEKGVLDNTLIALSADHYPYGLEMDELNELAGRKVEENFELYKSTFILYNKNMEPTTITKPCSSLDILPTLSNLLGLHYDSRLLMGRDIFSEESPLVIFHNKSFITDKGSYHAKTKEFINKTEEQVTTDYVKAVMKQVDEKIHYSAKILDEDYYAILLDPEYKVE